MEQIPHEKPKLDEISKEAHKLFETYQVDTLQEALHIDRAIKLIEKYLEKGKLTMKMPLEEVLETLEESKEELLGPDEGSLYEKD